MVETLRFITDAVWYQFLEEQLEWDFEDFDELSRFDEGRRFGGYIDDPNLSGVYTDSYKSFEFGVGYNNLYEVVFDSTGGPVELHQIFNPQKKSLGEPVRRYPTLRTFFRDICVRSDRHGEKDTELRKSFRCELWKYIDRYALWCLRRRVDVVRVTLQGLMPSCLEEIVLSYLEPPSLKKFSKDSEGLLKTDGTGLELTTEWCGETILVIKVVTG